MAAPVRMVDSKATPGLPFATSSSDMRTWGHMRQRECAHDIRTRQGNAQRERQAMQAMGAMGKRELALVLASESLQYKEDQEEGKAKGRKHVK